MKIPKDVRALIIAFQEFAWGIMVRDPRTAVVWSINSAFEEMSGFENEKVRGTPAVQLPWRFISLKKKPLTLADLGRDDPEAGVKHPLWGLVVGIVRPDGSVVYVTANTQPYPNQETPKAVITSMVDITEQVRAAEERELLESSKREVSQRLGHELRTPIAIINGYLWLMRELALGGMTPEQIGVIDHILFPQLQRIIDISDQSIALTMQNADLRDIELAPVLEKVAAEFPWKGERASLEYRPCPRDLSCRGNEGLLRQCLRYVLDNAFKFTPLHGNVILEAWEEDGDCVVAITDTGIGIAEDNLEKIFSPFFQAEEKSDTRKYGGLGLGLTAVRWNMELMGGTVTVSSQEGLGSCFELRLKRETAAQEG